MTAENLLRAEEITYRKVQTFDRERSVCFLPVSALEVHGPHLPLGMDVFMARWMAEETARRFAERHPDWTVVVYPPLTVGTDELPLPGSMHVNQQVLYNTLVSHGRSLAQAGYGYAVITNGHGGPRHAVALEAACHEVRRRFDIRMFTPAVAVLYEIMRGHRFDEIERLIARRLSEQERSGLLSGEHAGSWETSFMLAQQADLVDPVHRQLHQDGPPSFRPLAALGRPAEAALRGLGLRDLAPTAEVVIGTVARGIGSLLNATRGYGGPQVTYHGDPSVGSAEIGHAFREVMAADCLAIVEDVTQGRRSAEDVRSIASDVAFLDPRFGRAVSAAAAALFNIALILLTLRLLGRRPNADGEGAEED